jgi:DNA-binding transcriptional ArsR family regulator
MVIAMTTTAVLDEGLTSEVFTALADPTRRAVVEQLGRGPAATTELASAFDMALPSFMAHLDLLGRSGLVTSEKQGRVRTYQLIPTGLAPAERWLDAQHRLWSTRLDQLDTYLNTLKGEQ